VSQRRPIRFGLRTRESSSAGPFLLDHLPLFADRLEAHRRVMRARVARRSAENGK
jgi:hypothetical protein